MTNLETVHNKVAANGTTFAAHCHIPGAELRSIGFRIAEFNDKGQRIRFLFPSMRPFATAEDAAAKLAARAIDAKG